VRTGTVPSPSTRSGTAVNESTGRWQLPEAGQVLDDGNTGREQQGVRGPLAVGGVIDVERVDADQCHVLAGEPYGGGPGQEMPVFA
jgi:hypothetical protein